MGRTWKICWGVGDHVTFRINVLIIIIIGSTEHIEMDTRTLEISSLGGYCMRF